MAHSLEGKHAIVTGAARGIGRETALLYADAGAVVSVIDILDPKDTVEAIRARGGKAEGYAVDIQERTEVRGAIDRAAAQNGGVHALTCSAGIYGTIGSLDDIDEAEVSRVLGVNVEGVLWTLQAAVPHMRKSGGTVVCIGSVAGRVGGVLAGPPYAASKGAVHALVRWLAKAEAKNKIRVNGIAPGAIDTDMITGKGYPPDYCPMGRLGQPEEIASVALFLSTNASSYMTGAVVDVNGGYHFS